MSAGLAPGSRLELLMTDAQQRFPLLEDLTLISEPQNDQVRLFWRFRGEQYSAHQTRGGDYIVTASALLKELKDWYDKMTRGVWASELHGVKP